MYGVGSKAQILLEYDALAAAARGALLRRQSLSTCLFTDPRLGKTAVRGTLSALLESLGGMEITAVTREPAPSPAMTGARRMSRAAPGSVAARYAPICQTVSQEGAPAWPRM